MDLTLTPIGPLSEFGATTLAPDIVWSGLAGDFLVSGFPEDGGVGGFTAVNPLSTAVLMLLFSDARPDPRTFYGVWPDDPRGWVGDGFDIGPDESPLGSDLWRYRRESPSETLAREIAAAAERALKPLISQGIVDRIVTRSELTAAGDGILLGIDLIGRGRKLFSANFDPLWRRADGGL